MRPFSCPLPAFFLAVSSWSRESERSVLIGGSSAQYVYVGQPVKLSSYCDLQSWLFCQHQRSHAAQCDCDVRFSAFYFFKRAALFKMHPRDVLDLRHRVILPQLQRRNICKREQHRVLAVSCWNVVQNWNAGRLSSLQFKRYNHQRTRPLRNPAVFASASDDHGIGRSSTYCLLWHWSISLIQR
jgi:hypothetical protein